MLGGGGWFSKMSSTKMWLCYSWTGSGGICINMDTALTDSKVTGEVYPFFFFSFFFRGWGGWRWGWGVLWCLIILRIRSSLSLRNFNLFPGRTYASPPRSLPSRLMVDEQRGRHSRLFWAFSEFILMLIVFGLHISTAKKNICPQYQPCTVQTLLQHRRWWDVTIVPFKGKSMYLTLLSYLRALQHELGHGVTKWICGRPCTTHQAWCELKKLLSTM